MTVRRRVTAPTAANERGASLIEYALVVAVLLAVCIGGVSLFGEATQRSISGSAETVSTAGG